MAKYQRFDDLPVWQEAARLYQRVQDLLEENGVPLSTPLKAQLDRAALGVSNNIAGSFDRMPTSEMIRHLAQARSAAAEVQSIAAVLVQRPKLARLVEALNEIRTLAESCGRQLSAWLATVDNGGAPRGKVPGQEASRAASMTAPGSPPGNR
jgi:four helix bundle protein